MIKSVDLIKLYGDPSIDTIKWERKNMVVWQVPSFITEYIECLPKKMYVHYTFQDTLHDWFEHLLSNGLYKEIKTYDGCWNVRKKRGLSTLSIHAFGMAVDLNASHNPLGLNRDQCIAKGLKPFSNKFIDASRKYLDCGADWQTRPDLMHFQIKKGN
jgi:hypothetical protein